MFKFKINVNKKYMNKKELIKKIKNKSSLSQKNIRDCLDILSEIIVEALKTGEEVKIKNFGKFYIKESKERNMYNPSVNKITLIQPRKKADFKTSFSLNKKIF